MFDLDQWRSWPVSQNSTTAWLVAGAITSAAIVILLVARTLIRRYAERLSKTERREFLEIPMLVLSRTTVLFIVTVSMYFGLRSLELGDRLGRVIDSIITISAFVQFGLWAAAAVHAWIERRRLSAADRAMVGSLSIISF